MFAVLILSAPFIKRKPEEWVLILSSLLFIAMMLLQNSGVMEGRYRKPVEPVLIIVMAIILSGKPHNQSMSLYAFTMQIYIRPVVAWLRNIMPK